jgi:hypothetical protein
LYVDCLMNNCTKDSMTDNYYTLKATAVLLYVVINLLIKCAIKLPETGCSPTGNQ